MKPQDVIVLCSLIANKECQNWKQSEIASKLCMSVSTINASLKRLLKSRLIVSHLLHCNKYHPIRSQCMEFFIKGFSYIFLPGQKFHPKLNEIMNKNTQEFSDFFSLLLKVNLERPLKEETRESIRTSLDSFFEKEEIISNI